MRSHTSVGFPQSRGERRLQDKVQSLLPAGEDVRAAVVGVTGPPPSAVGALAVVGSLLGLVGLVGVAGAVTPREDFTVAATSEGVVVFRNDGCRGPVEIVGRVEDIRAVVVRDGLARDSTVEIAGRRYFVTPIWSGQLYALKRLGADSRLD
jgi:hypothetical protein